MADHSDLVESQQVEIRTLEERLAVLEYALESPEWRWLTHMADQEFSRSGLRNICELARVMQIKNPIVKRGVEVKRLYVWGQGWSVRAADEAVQACIDEFLYNDDNDDILGSHESRMQLETELEVDGNLFFAFFTNPATGDIIVRTIPIAEVEDIICNPEDARRPWYYLRLFTETGTDGVSVQRAALYPDWRFNPTARPSTLNGYPIRWESPVYHVRIGGFSNWKFGLSEIYSAIDWARAYKENLEDWSSIVRAYRKFAFQLTTPGGAKGVAAAKAKLSTTLGGGSGERNPAPLAGSTFVGAEGATLQPISTGGATVSPEDGRRLLLMVAASFGLPETFFGDASIGSLATAKSLDRPTELMMEDRQHLWADVFTNIINYALRWAVKAPQGSLRTLGTVTAELRNGQVRESVKWDDEEAATLTIEFPPLLQHDVPALVNSIVQAATLGSGGQLAGTIDLVSLSRLLLTTLGVANVDEILEGMFPDGEIPEEEDPTPSPPPATEEEEPEAEERPQAEAMMLEAVKEMRDAIARLAG